MNTYLKWRAVHNLIFQLDDVDVDFDQNDVGSLAAFFVIICDRALPLGSSWKQTMVDEFTKLATYDMLERLRPLLEAFYADVHSDSVLGMMAIIVSTFVNIRRATRPILHSIDILYFTPKERVSTGLRALIISAYINTPEANARLKELPEDTRLFIKERFISWKYAQIVLRLDPKISEALARLEKEEDEEGRKHVVFID